jgi:hypothetical protein
LYNNISLYNGEDWGTVIDLRRHLPDFSCAEFLKWYFKTFCLYPDIDTDRSTWTIRHVDDILNAEEVLDWSDMVIKEHYISKDDNTPSYLGYEQPDYVEIESWTEVDKSSDMIGTPSPSGVYYIKSLNMFSRAITTGGDSLEIARQFRKYEINPDSKNEEFLSKLTPLLMKRAISAPPPGGGIADINLYPEAKYEGYVSGVSQGEKCGLHMVFYRGMQPNNNSSNYPLASNCIYGVNENPITGLEYSLLWNHEKGMYHKFWKNWIYFLRHRRIIRRRLLLDLPNFLKFRWHYKVRIGNMLYFCNSLKAVMGTGDKIEVEVELSSIMFS